MRFIFTDGGNPDFIELCHCLDEFLNGLVGGEENRAEYIPYNRLDDIHDVIIAYDAAIPVGSASFRNSSKLWHNSMKSEFPPSVYINLILIPPHIQL